MLNQSASTLLAVIVLATAGCNSLPTRMMQSGTTTSPDVEQEHAKAVALMKVSRLEDAIEHFDAISQVDNRLASPYLNMGIAYARLGDNDKARTALLASIERDASNPVAWNQLAILYRQEGAFDKALDTYKKSLRKSPDDPDTHWNLGILHEVYLDHPKKALNHYQEYQRLTNSDDQKLLLWISDLQQETRAGTLTAGVKKP